MTRIVFMGRKQVAADSLVWLNDQAGVQVVAVITDSHLENSPTSAVARSLGIPVMSRQQVEDSVSKQAIEFDLGLSMLYWQKIRAPILDRATLGVVNFHPAPLPDFKGTAGYNVAILNGLSEWASSAHYVDKDIDTGPIIDVSHFPFDAGTATAYTLEARTRIALFDQFKSVVGRILKQRERLPTTENVGGRYIARAEMEAMKEVRPGDDLDRKVRAFWFPPYDGAYVVVDGKKYTLVNRTILETLADPSATSLFSAAT